MRLLVINNLSAGKGDAAIYDFVRAFSKDDDEVTIRTTDGTTRAETFLHDAGEFDAVVAAGGDGTVTSICYALRNTNIPVLPFPSGTANLLAINLDSPTEPHALANLARKCDTMDFDIGEITLGDQTMGFIIIAGAGYDAAIMEYAAKLKSMAGESAYLLAALMNPNPTVSHFTLTLDGETVETDGIAVLLVNFAKMQFEIPVTPDNNPRDGLLEIAILKSQNTVQLLPIAFAALLDRDGRFPTRTSNFELHRAREINVVADPPLTIQYDGEPTGLNTPFSARAIPCAARIIVDKASEKIQRLSPLSEAQV
ncbi:MAG: diacylglycerol kinase [Actinobacteria bacterium]|nr:diacylglycerol kinase [Actinomycetota bacterium]